MKDIVQLEPNNFNKSKSLELLNCLKDSFALQVKISYKNIKELIKSGANVNINTKAGLTPLMIAVKLGELKIVKILINAKAEINAQDNYNKRNINTLEDSEDIEQENSSFELYNPRKKIRVRCSKSNN